jgi:hypothetical protein
MFSAMKRHSPRQTTQAMTLLEVLVVLAVFFIVVALLLPPPHGVSRRTNPCLSQLMQIDLGFILYAADNNGKYPMQTSITNGGTMECLQRNQTFPHFQKVAEYLRDTRMLICPMDKNRHPTNFEQLADINLSYFLNVDVETNNPSALIFAGDRNLQKNGQPVPPGLFTLTTNLDVGFTRELHPYGGTLAFADGHAEFCRTKDLNSLVKRQNIAASRLSIP